MPRKPRKKSGTGIYHVIVRGVGQQDIFREGDDFHRFLKTMKKVSLESEISILGYCLMTNHVHLLLREDNSDVSLFMKRLGVSYAYWYNRKYERTGHLFQDRFKSECVEDEAYLMTVIRYIHQNPVKASLTANPEDYEWSSCAEYYQQDSKCAMITDRRLILSIFHKDQQTAIKELQKFTAAGNQDNCLDCDEIKRISESEAYEITKRIMKGDPVMAIQEMGQDARKIILNRLRTSGLSLRQICRITGLPFHVVRKS